MIFQAEIQGGKVIWYNRQAVAEFISAHEGHRVSIEIEQFRARRSNRQNRFYHGVVVKMLSEHLGYEVEEIHDILKTRFLMDYVTKEGRRFPIVRSTAGLTTDGFTDYLERIQRWAAQELNLVIPDPE